MTFFSRREWAVTVFWAPQLCLMLAGCVKETTPPARSTKDCTASSIILTVSQRGWLELVGWFYWLWWVYLKACKRFVYPFIPSFLSCLLSVYSLYRAPIFFLSMIVIFLLFSFWCFFKVLYSFSEYYGVVTIPAGARSIRVMELNTSSSYLAVRDTQRHYYLNGHWTVDWPGRHPIAGAIFEYKRPYNRPESLIATGPINETLVIEVKEQWVVSFPIFHSSMTFVISCIRCLCYFSFSLFLPHLFSCRYCCRAGTQVYVGNTLWRKLMRKGITSNTIIHGPSYALNVQQLVPEVSVNMND